MKIDRNLNLVIPLETDSGKVFIHSTPIARDVYETFFLVMSKTFAALFNEGLGATAGPATAFLMLRQVATDLGQWPAVEKGLVNEIMRLSNIAYAGAKGWETIDLNSAFDRGILEIDERSEVLGAIVFFTLLARVGNRRTTMQLQEAANGLWGSALTALSFMEYLNSLPTSMPAVSTGATQEPPMATEKPASVPV